MVDENSVVVFHEAKSKAGWASLARNHRTFDALAIADTFKDAFGGPSYLERFTDELERDRERRRLLSLAKEELFTVASKSAENTCWELGVDPIRGLSRAEVESRQRHVGPNELLRDPPPTFRQLLGDQFKDILIWMLITAMTFSAVQGHIAETVVLFLLIGFNSLVGVKMEMGAASALDALQNANPPLTEVKRDGVEKEVPSASLVPGDIVILRLGKSVPADIRLVTSAGLEANEASLTGEPEPVKKDAAWTALKERVEENEEKTGSLKDATGVDKEAKATSPKDGAMRAEKTTFNNMVYMGCLIQEGHGEGVVIRTGMETEMGAIAHLLKQTTQNASPLQRKLKVVGTRLGILALCVAVLVLIIGITTGKGSDPKNRSPIWLQMIEVTIALTVAAIPEAIPVTVTMCLALGMTVMAKVHKAQILKLKSVETLGSASVICTDKTGTLTKGEMTAVRVWCCNLNFYVSGVGYEPMGYISTLEGKNSSESDLMADHKKWENGVQRLPILLAALCNNASIKFNEGEGKWEALGNVTERPLVVLAKKAGYEKEKLNHLFMKINEQPFSSTTKQMSTVHLIPQGSSEYTLFFPNAKYLVATKGAPNMLLQRCNRIADLDENDDPSNLSKPIQTRQLLKDEKTQILQLVDGLSSQALRVLAVAYELHDTEPGDRKHSTEEVKCTENLIFAGLIGNIDPERAEVGPCIAQATRAGIRIVMITGDYVTTAKAIAENIGILPPNSDMNRAIDCEVIRGLGATEAKLTDRIKKLERRLKRGLRAVTIRDKVKKTWPCLTVEEEECKDEESEEDDEVISSIKTIDLKLLTPEEEELIRKRISKLKQDVVLPRQQLDTLCSQANVFARALPKDKITIVSSLQRQGQVCAMTGDGVNDAPALRKADIGVAMGITGTDVAKAAADMILITDSFVSILAAVRQGRITYANIQKFVYYLLSTNGAEVILMLLAICLGLQSPLSAVQLLWLNASDNLPTMALALEHPEPDIMNQEPRPSKESLIDKLVITGIIIHVPILTGVALGTYILGLYWETGEWNAITLRNECETERSACDDYSHRVNIAQTMTILVLIFAELLRSYSARSLRLSVFEMGLLSNKWLQAAVIFVTALTLLFSLTPGLNDAFGLSLIPARAWGWVIGVSFIPVALEEFVKLIYRLTGYGLRPITNA